ncbi:uncharacterized protein J4E78_009493 [Alternaria triticimaculans]|uniref:uncharacterized protein n=1 Tax=Alternaria triticimaculans TaxID=297637 RepID=UPI0020C2E7C8|nr:uncharacterized protein J4E78_009493 [Alternaria triticimaculans]KAI4644674.1 hypothetical protein J4E78_009493 [Alternaria triticimaculans]
MGIQGLARRLEPYATRLSSEQLDGYSAVIDGPALAYHAHKLALASAASATRIPSYADIVAEALRWLTSLENSNIKVSAIYFDGALPTTKRAERLSRTEANNRRVQQFRNNYATVSCPVPTYLGSISYAFLAPALQEALLDSPFASKTQTVPGEADDWCASHAKDHPRSIIFTSDTDLVLYDYFIDTLIVFLYDADVSTGIKAYSPNEIRKQLQVTSLVTFAYTLIENPQDSAKLLAHQAHAVDRNSVRYLDFARRYVAEDPTIVSPGGPHWEEVPRIDVRLSEFMFQAFDRMEFPHVYMPLLIEEPNQASAWNVGREIRRLAYTIAAKYVYTVVQEYRRKAQGISVQEISIYPPCFDQTPVEDLERQMRGLKEWRDAESISSELLWPLYGISLVLNELNTPPPIALVQRVLNCDFDNSWAFVHLTARLHAALYSLRMLLQMIKVGEATMVPDLIVDVNDRQDVAHAQLRENMSKIANHMSDFPSIPEVMGVPGQTKRILAEHDKLKELIEEIYRSAGVEVPSEQVSNKKKKRQMREGERKKKKAEQRMQAKPQVGNAYSLLGEG